MHPLFWGLQAFVWVNPSRFLEFKPSRDAFDFKALAFHYHTVRRHQRAIANVGAVKQNGAVTLRP